MWALIKLVCPGKGFVICERCYRKEWEGNSSEN